VSEHECGEGSPDAHNASHRTFPVHVPHGVLEQIYKIKPVLNERNEVHTVDQFHRDETCLCNALQG
jgi:hypothetical protein